MSAAPKLNHDPNAHNTPTSREAKYLELDANSNTRHELLLGEIIAFAGASYRHNLITSNIQFAFTSQLRAKKKPCKVLSSELRVNIEASQSYTYPDVLVTCGAPHFLENTFDTLTNPTLVVEILSPSTATYDLMAKRLLYQQIDSLQHYLVVSQHTAHIWHHFRAEDGTWHAQDYTTLAASFALPDLDLNLVLADVYDDVMFDDPPTPPEILAD